MRIEIDKLVEIKKVVDCDVEVGGVDDNTISLRFGYWNMISEEHLAKVNEILGHREIQLQLVDEDDECGELWNYLVTYNPFN